MWDGCPRCYHRICRLTICSTEYNVTYGVCTNAFCNFITEPNTSPSQLRTCLMFFSSSSNSVKAPKAYFLLLRTKMIIYMLIILYSCNYLYICVAFCSASYKGYPHRGPTQRSTQGTYTWIHTREDPHRGNLHQGPIQRNTRSTRTWKHTQVIQNLGNPQNGPT